MAEELSMAIAEVISEDEETGAPLYAYRKPDRYILMNPDVELSSRHTCGASKMERMGIAKHSLKQAEGISAECCYEMAPGASCTVKISFHSPKSKIKPKGELLLEAKRGKLSPSRVELDGKKESIEVKYQAPDETVKVSLRAYVEGFYRGKVHLHLEES